LSGDGLSHVSQWIGVTEKLLEDLEAVAMEGVTSRHFLWIFGIGNSIFQTALSVFVKDVFSL
jgi:hypothetical protein